MSGAKEQFTVTGTDDLTGVTGKLRKTKVKDLVAVADETDSLRQTLNLYKSLADAEAWSVILEMDDSDFAEMQRAHAEFYGSTQGK